MVRERKVRSDPRPLYERAEEALEALLARTRPGQKLPAEPRLAERMGISRATLREALRAFAQQGRIVRRQGVGTFVALPHPVIENGLEVLESLDTLGRRQGLQMRMARLRIEERSATAADAQKLGVGLGASLWVITRVIQQDGAAIAYLEDLVPCAYLGRVELDGFAGSVLDILLARGDPPLAHSQTYITAAPAPRELREMLGLPQGGALLKMEARLISNDSRVVDYSSSYFVPGFFRFHVIRRVNGEHAPKGMGSGLGGS